MAEPRALIIEDADVHAFIAQTILQQAGFQVTCASSLALGIEQVYTLLNMAQPASPTLILLDLMLPYDQCPILEGTAVIAYLTGQMETGDLRPAHIVAISGVLTQQREQESIIAGAHMAIAKPLTIDHAYMLRAQVNQRPLLPSESDAQFDNIKAEHRRAIRRAQRREAAQLLYFLRSERAYSTAPIMAGAGPATILAQEIWNAGVVRTLLTNPTSILRQEPWRSWILARGGLEQIRRRLREARLSSPDRKPLLNKVLENGDNWQRSADELNISRAKYYRDLEQIVAELADTLNAWE